MEGVYQQPVWLTKLQVDLGSGTEMTIRMSNDKSGGTEKESDRRYSEEWN